MKPLDNASLEASKKLVDNGIVLETEKSFHAYPSPKYGKWLYNLINTNLDNTEDIPAPSMAEVWRELPEHYNGGRKCLMMAEGINIAGYSNGNGFDCSNNFPNRNPTDALIDLLIWVIKDKPWRCISRISCGVYEERRMKDDV
jgi:hypothetical protein